MLAQQKMCERRGFQIAWRAIFGLSWFDSKGQLVGENGEGNGIYIPLQISRLQICTHDGLPDKLQNDDVPKGISDFMMVGLRHAKMGLDERNNLKLDVPRGNLAFGIEIAAMQRQLRIYQDQRRFQTLGPL